MMNGNSCAGAELAGKLKQILSEGGCENARGEAGFILESLTGKSFPMLLAEREPLREDIEEKALEMCRRRISGEPLQYILGEWDFFGMTFRVGEGVLIPRPDTETLAETAIMLRKDFPSTNYADLCSGSGCVAAAVSKYLKNVKCTAVEKSPDAFRYLKENLSVLAPQAELCHEDALLPETAAKHTELDLITANPPYLTDEDMQSLQKEVSYEPALALFGGSDGLMFYRELTRVWKNSLREGGWLVYEAGMGQYRDVMDILTENGFRDVSFACDLAGIERVIYGRK